MFLWELKNGIISTNLRELCVIKINTNIPHTVASTSSATNSFITRCLSLSKAHYFYCIKIRVLYRTSLMFLWELKNGIISTNLRELCVIKANIKSTHSGFDKLSHQFFYYTLPEPVEGTFSLLISVPEPVEGTIISIVLKYVCFLEHLWCSFGSSKTASFQQISVNFVL